MYKLLQVIALIVVCHRVEAYRNPQAGKYLHQPVFDNSHTHKQQHETFSNGWVFAMFFKLTLLSILFTCWTTPKHTSKKTRQTFVLTQQLLEASQFAYEHVKRGARRISRASTISGLSRESSMTLPE